MAVASVGFGQGERKLAHPAVLAIVVGLFGLRTKGLWRPLLVATAVAAFFERDKDKDRERALAWPGRVVSNVQ